MTAIRIESTANSPALNVDDGGSGGLPVVFVHSLAGNTDHWSRQLEHLREDRRAVAIDLRGHGRSDSARDGNYSIEAMADDIESVAAALGLGRFILAGHSMGASASIEYTGRHPDAVAGLLLADPSGDARKIPAEQFAPFMAALESDSYASAIEDYWKVMLANSSPSVRERLMRDLRAMPKEIVIKVFGSSLQFDPITPLQRYPGKKLSVITHLNDTPISLHNLLPDLPHVSISGTGHWLQLDKPEEFNRIMDEFISSI
jgi:pimeloyl-ACP methyl ester carboxylesterase